MQCEDYEGLLDLNMDGDLCEEARDRAERHLMRCPRCAFELRTLERTRALLREAHPPVEADETLRVRVLARLRAAFPFHARPAAPEGRQYALPLFRGA